MSEWVLVPREPTKEMREAAYDSTAIASNGHFACRDSWARAYPAMLAAAPKPPEQEIELPPVEHTVASITDDELLRRVVRHVARNRASRKEFVWAAVSEAFALGSTFSMQLCRRFGLDPDTGAELKTHNVAGKAPAAPADGRP